LKKNIIIVGTGGVAKEVLFLIREINKVKPQWDPIGLIDQNPEKVGNKFCDIKIIGTDDYILNYLEEINIVIAIGNPSLRKKVFELYRDNKFLNFPNLIHPNVVGDWENIDIGIANIICPGTVFTTSLEIGNCNYFNMTCTIGHDVKMGSYNVLNPMVSLSGGANLKDENLFGTGSRVLQRIEICNNCIIGADALVTKNIKISGTYIGSPARLILKNEKE